jgi:putative Ig domain-containing protein
MSKLQRNLFRGRPDFLAFVSSGPRVVPCALLLIGLLLTTSCGFITQSEAGPSSHASSLNLSGTFPAGMTNQAYNAVLAVSGGIAPYQFAIKSGSLPAGMSLNPATGSVSGTPTVAGTYIFEVGVTDSPLPHHGSQNFVISIDPHGGGGIRVAVSPVSVNLLSGEMQTFTATVTGTDNTAVTWTASAGSITDGGSFTAPVVSGVTNVSITATSKADPKIHGTATVTVEPANGHSLSITTGNLPDGRTGTSYNAGFSATGGTQPYSWTVSQGNLPPGLSLSHDGGELAGMPGTVGGYSFSIKVTDAKAQATQKNFTLNVAAGGETDGPAELPRVSVSSAMADTPAPGATINVNAGGDLQAALNSAHCGDTIELQAGASFSGTFDFPAKSCDNNRWIIVRTSAPDSALPPEGQRLTPCYAGVASLPGRPQYSCGNSQNVLAKIQLQAAGGSPITFLTGANHYRLLGLEVTRLAGVKAAPTLIAVDNQGVADHIILDRSWLHGTTQDDTQNGMSFQGMNYAAAVDSYFSDFHCTSVTGTCSDAHAVGGGNGNHQDGPFKVAGNFLEASGEAVMFGGGAATVTPTDIEIRRNHFFKPMQWMPGNPKFVGGTSGKPFVVKNHLELKNAIRVLVEANLMENSWGGFSQTGHAILLTPKNQHTRDGNNVCPICQVTDVTIRYVRIAHAGGGIVFATAISGNGDGKGAAALSGTRWSVHDVVMDDISRSYVGGGALFMVQNGWPKDPVNTVTVNHITGFPDPDSHILSMGNQETNQQMYAFVFTNNIVTTGRYPVWSTGGGDTSCAYHGTPAQKVASCFATYKFSNNALIATPNAFPPSSWPAGNLFPQTPNDAQFVRYDENGGGDYALRPGSPYKNAGTDGRDLGADVVGLDAALAGVE